MAHIDDRRGWEAFVDDLTVISTPGDHDSLVLGEHALTLATSIERVLSNTHRRSDQQASSEPLADGSSEAVDRFDYVYRFEPELPVESALLGEIVRPDMRTLDVGTAATGRSAKLLRDLGAEVHSIEVNQAAIVEFAGTGQGDGMGLAVADLLALPFDDESFDLVLVALHGLDYIVDDADRQRAFEEVERVLRPGGHFVFNAFNPLGIVLTPANLRQWEMLKLRLKYVATGRFVRRTLIDPHGMELHQGTPLRVTRQIESTTGLRRQSIANQSDSTRRFWPVVVLASAPYYVFRRSASTPSSV